MEARAEHSGGWRGIDQRWKQVRVPEKQLPPLRVVQGGKDRPRDEMRTPEKAANAQVKDKLAEQRDALLENLRAIQDPVEAFHAFQNAEQTGLLRPSDLLTDVDVRFKVFQGSMRELKSTTDAAKAEKAKVREEEQKQALRDAWDAFDAIDDPTPSLDEIHQLGESLKKEESEEWEELDEEDILEYGPPPIPALDAKKQDEFARMIDEGIAEANKQEAAARTATTPGEQLQAIRQQRRQEAMRTRGLTDYLASDVVPDSLVEEVQAEDLETQPAPLTSQVDTALKKLEKSERAFRENASWNFRDLMEDFNITNFYINDDGTIPAGFLGKNRITFELFRRRNSDFARRYDEMKDRYLRRAPLTEAEERGVTQAKQDAGSVKPEGFGKKLLRQLGWLGTGAAATAAGYAGHIQQERHQLEQQTTELQQQLTTKQLDDLQRPSGSVSFDLKPEYRQVNFTEPEVIEGKRLGLRIGRDVTPYLKSVFENLRPGQEARVPFGESGRMFINVKKANGPSGRQHGEFTLYGVDPDVPPATLSDWLTETFTLKRKPKVELIKEFQSTGLTRPWINGQISYTADGPKLFGDVAGLLYGTHRAPSPIEVQQEGSLVREALPPEVPVSDLQPGLRANYEPQTTNEQGEFVSRSEAPFGPLMEPAFSVEPNPHTEPANNKDEMYNDMRARAEFEWEEAKRVWAEQRRQAKQPLQSGPLYYDRPKIRPEDIRRRDDLAAITDRKKIATKPEDAVPLEAKKEEE